MWTKYIKSNVFTRIKVEGMALLKEDYPNIYFTTSGRSLTKPKFPTVYLKKLQGGEIGRTLDGTSVNGTISGFQVDVTDNESESNAENVSYVIADIMKSMGYEMVGEPFPDDKGSEYRYSARYRRPVCAGDKL